MRGGPANALERAISDACLGQTTGAAISRDLRGFLEARGVATDDIDAIMAAQPRLQVYRSLVQNGLNAVVARMLPRTRARMNASCAGRFDLDVARFLDEVGPRTHYLRDLPGEIVEWADPRWRADSGVPAYLPDLAVHELTCFAVAAAEQEPPAQLQPEGDVLLERRLVFTRSARRVRYSWAVHELPADEGATAPPAQRDVRLLAYRDDDHAVRWLELTPLASSIVERLIEGEPLGRAVERACADHTTAPSAVAEDISRLLADLAERGALLG